MLKHNPTYIKTTSGIYKIYEHAPADHVYQEAYLGRRHVPSQVHVLRNSIKKESDDLYQLCDFVAIKHVYEEIPHIVGLREMDKKALKIGGYHQYLDNLKLLIELSNSRGPDSEFKLDYIKFAILVEDGLKFVAEMDDEGCIELL